ncbi:MAG: ABC-F family ATP-binding cassette domain-containing protein [Clostridia bacterium]|nr:ABC-F family ATP-binding cassette domain-containing protein [Clostridia bacterium]
MIQLNDICIYLTVNGRALVSGLSFTLNPADRTVIIGEEGNGKSTLLKLIADPALIADHAEYTGSIFKGGHRIGYLPQELTPDEAALPIRDYLALDESTLWLAEYTAEELGLPAALLTETRPVSTLSGGERVKLRMVKVMLSEPDMLLLDEPTNDIDIETLEWLEGFIRRFRGGVLFVSHDETLIENTASAVIHLEHVHHKKVARHTVANMPYREYIERRERAFSHQEQVALKERDEQQKKEERWREIYEKVDSAQRNLSRQDPSTGRLLKKKMHSVMSQGRRLEKERESMTELPVTERQIFLDLPPVELPRRKEILRFKTEGLYSPAGERLTAGFELNADAAEHIGIIGRNGVGKTTLLRLIERELAPRRDIKLFYMPQNYFDLLDGSETPVEFLAPSGRKEDITNARTYLGSVRFTADEAESPIARLSGGQKAKLMFVRMALEGCNVLLLDEPTRNFSPLSNPVIRSILARFGGCIISVTHDRKYLAEVCTRVLRLTEEGLFPADNVTP